MYQIFFYIFVEIYISNIELHIILFKTTIMKKAFLSKAIVLVALISSPLLAIAQTVGPSAGTANQNLSLTVEGKALIAVVNTVAANTNISLSLTGASVAGEAMQTVITNSDSKLRISSSVEDGTTRKITAQISPNLTASNTELFVELVNPGTFLPAADNGGAGSGEVNLTDGTAIDVVTGIKTCWSGTGATDGYGVTYRYAKKANTTFWTSGSTVVTYTITAAV